MLRIVGVGNFFFVDPGVGVELVGLEDVGELAGLFESAKGKGVGGFDFGVFVNVGDRAGVEHEAGDAFFGKDFCGHAAGVAGANDQDVNYFFRHKLYCFPQRLKPLAFSILMARLKPCLFRDCLRGAVTGVGAVDGREAVAMKVGVDRVPI